MHILFKNFTITYRSAKMTSFLVVYTCIPNFPKKGKIEVTKFFLKVIVIAKKKCY